VGAGSPTRLWRHRIGGGPLSKKGVAELDYEPLRLQSVADPFLCSSLPVGLPQALAPFLGCPQGYSVGDFEARGSLRPQLIHILIQQRPDE
jgi:hypothetical protein